LQNAGAAPDALACAGRPESAITGCSVPDMKQQPSTRATALAADTSVIGKVRLEGVLARGGMGVVYRGHHQTLDVDVAVKMLPGRLAENPDFARA